MRQGRCGAAVLLLLIGMAAAPGAEASQAEPAFLTGLAKMIAGPTIELPSAVIEYTLRRPLLLGPLTGLLVGTTRAIRTMLQGAGEFLSVPFQPSSY